MKARDVRVFFSDRTVIAYSMVDVLCFQTRLSYKYSEPRKLSHMEGGNKVDWILLAAGEQGGIEFTMRKHYDKGFKARVALEAIKGEKTIQEIGTIYQVHPNLVALWKKQVVEKASGLFEKDTKDKEAQEATHKEEELYRQIGQLQVENEFLKR